MSWIYDKISQCYRFQQGGTVQYTPSPEILEYVLGKETFKPEWYKDGNGNWTIGYGFKESTTLNRRNTKSMSKQEATRKFNQEYVPVFTNDLVRLTPNFDKLNQNQRDALFSYMYNFGNTNYKNSSKMQKALTDLNHSEVVKQMDAGYNDPKNPGLRIRRDEERQWYNKPIAQPKPRTPKPIQQPPQKKKWWQIMMEPMMNDPIFYSK